MIFGALDIATVPALARDGRVAVLAHSHKVGAKRMGKGTALDAAALERLKDAGIRVVEAALPEPGDVGEDEAATACAASLLDAPLGEGTRLTADRASTGRVNLRAARAGLFAVKPALVDRLNAIDARLTIATLAPFTRVERGELVATVKIIPFFVPSDAVARWRVCVRDDAYNGANARDNTDVRDGAIGVRPWRAMRVAHLSTVLDGTKPNVLDKTRRALAARLDATQATLMPERRVAHERDALAGALEDTSRDAPGLVIVFGASAVTDERDVVPDAIRSAGGTVERVGMPVDPGNLLVLGTLGGARVIGAPGCARSPASNGFDLVLDRLLAGIAVDGDDLARMGVGGLLKETPRPRPREASDTL